MYTIFFNSKNEGHNFESFKDRMIQICNENRKISRAHVFAFILYDFENPHLSKILNDQEYFLALNRISGEYLTVFSINYREKKERKLLTGDNSMQMITNVSMIQNPAMGTNELIEKYFGNIKIQYPAILFFQVDNESVIDSLLIELEEEDIQLSFLELKYYITEAVTSLKIISPENKQNIRKMFNYLESKVKRANKKRRIMRILKKGGNIINIIISFKDLFNS